MTQLHLLLVSALALAFAACGSDGSRPGGNGMPDAPVQQLDAPAATGIPAWMLEDVQPLSPRTGQTYGLDTFSNKIVVVVLLEGF